jgi:acyl-coenzyme A thioesterase PaaI-like protein
MILWTGLLVLQKGYKVAMTEAEIIDDQHHIIAKGTGVYKILS